VSDRQDNPTAAFDDDRLLDYVLGLEDDPELSAALARSAPLRERLADLKADLVAIETELRETIPPLDASYAEPRSQRWPRLQRFYGGETGRRRPLHGRRLAATLAAAVLLVALLIRVRPGSSSSTFGSTGGGQRAPALGAGKTAEQAGGQAAVPGTPAPTPAPVTGAAAIAGLEQRYRDIAIARAGATTTERQTFTVVRVLKGDPRSRFTLRVAPGGATAAPGTLQLVFLHPVAGSSTPAASGTGDGAARVSGSGAASGTLFGPPVAFTWRGERAAVVSLEGVTDPATVGLP